MLKKWLKITNTDGIGLLSVRQETEAKHRVASRVGLAIRGIDERLRQMLLESHPKHRLLGQSERPVEAKQTDAVDRDSIPEVLPVPF